MTYIFELFQYVYSVSTNKHRQIKRILFVTNINKLFYYFSLSFKFLIYVSSSLNNETFLPSQIDSLFNNVSTNNKVLKKEYTYTFFLNNNKKRSFSFIEIPFRYNPIIVVHNLCLENSNHSP